MPSLTRSAASVQAATTTQSPYKKGDSLPDTTLPSLPSSSVASGPLDRVLPRRRNRKMTTAAPDTPVRSLRKRGRKYSAAEEVGELIELPHNLGTIRAAVKPPPDVGHPVTADIKGDDPFDLMEQGPHKKRRTNGEKAKKKEKVPYGLTPGVSPFPDWPRPTPEECEEVNRLLSSIHGDVKAPAAIPAPSLTVSGCGEVPSILDALLRTVLSGATTKANSGLAFEGLVKRFGVTEEGIGRGSVDWNKVRLASLEDIEKAIKSGGLAAIKSKNIKLILEMVYEQNTARRAALVKAEEGENGAEALTETDKYQAAELADDLLSLNHLHCLSKDEAMLEFVKFPGIGVKTAACVILFSLQRPCFAVDTHVFRLSKWLGWVPQEKKVDEITAFRHLEVHVPDHLKYSLHQLFLEHGKTCPRCRAATSDNSDAACVIDHLVAERTGKRKGKAASRRTPLLFENGDAKLEEKDDLEAGDTG